MIFWRFFRQAEDDLLDLVELMHTEYAAGFFAIAPSFGSETGSICSIAARQRGCVESLIGVIANQGLLGGADQSEVFAGERIGLIGEEGEISGTEEGLGFGQAGRHEQGKAALDQLLLSPEKHRLGQLCAGAAPEIKAGLCDFGAAGGINNAEFVAKRLMIERREGEVWFFPDKAQGGIVAVIGAIGNFRGKEIRQPGQLFLDLGFHLLHQGFFFGQSDLHLLDRFARIRVFLALLAQAVAFSTQGFDFMHQVKKLPVQCGQGIDIDFAAAPGGILFDQVGVFAEDFNVNHVLSFLLMVGTKLLKKIIARAVKSNGQGAGFSTTKNTKKLGVGWRQ